MSTKNLREVVEAYIKLTGPWDGRSPRTANAQAALVEVEAIEKAAKAIAACDLVYPRHVANEIDRASETIRCIAKETP